MIKLSIIITEGDFLSLSEQNRKQIKIITLSELNTQIRYLPPQKA